MLLLVARFACKAVMIKDPDGLSRRKTRFNCLFRLKYVKGEVGNDSVKQGGKSKLYKQ